MFSSSQNKKILSFLFVGGCTFLIYYLILWVCFSLLFINYQTSIAISYFWSCLFHFLLNRNVTFSAGTARYKNQIFRYILMAIFNYLIQLLVVIFFYEINGVNFYMSSIFAIVVTILCGYILMNFWVFKKEDL